MVTASADGAAVGCSGAVVGWSGAEVACGAAVVAGPAQATNTTLVMTSHGMLEARSFLMFIDCLLQNRILSCKDLECSDSSWIIFITLSLHLLKVI
jgi:hypothetical protein